jgi:hypothetical protein
MGFKTLQRYWENEQRAEASPHWAVLTHGRKSRGTLICISLVLCLVYSKYGHHLFKTCTTHVQLLPCGTGGVSRKAMLVVKGLLTSTLQLLMLEL